MPSSALKLFLGLFALALAITGVITWLQARAASRWVDAESHLIDHLAELKGTAKELIEARLVDGGEVVAAEEVPPALRVPGLEFAEVFPEHVNLVVDADPGERSGFRVWIDAVPEGYADAGTALPFVGRFRYAEDEPPSPTNRR